MASSRVLIVFATVALAVAPISAQQTEPTSKPSTRPTGGGSSRAAATNSRVIGTLLAIEGTKLVLEPRRAPGTSVDLVLDESAEIRVDGDPAQADAMRPGMQVTVVTLPATARRAARKMVSATSTSLDGTLVRLEGKRIVLRVASAEGGTREVSVDTDDKTRVEFIAMARQAGTSQPGREGALSDLAPEMRLKIVPASGIAKVVMAVPAH